MGSVVVGHIRNASNPRGIPHEEVVAPKNRQPFVRNGTIFAHNGVVRDRDQVASSCLGGVRLQGVNDSEVLFLMLLRNLEHCSPDKAFEVTGHEIYDAWSKRQGRAPRGPYGALNVLFAPGPTDLWAFCSYREADLSPSNQKRLTGDTAKPFYEMAYLATLAEVVVASEPLDDNPSWKELGDGHYLHAQIVDGKVVCEAPKALSIPRGT